MTMCKTVGELIEVLQKLDPSLPLYQKGTMGHCIQGVPVKKVKLAVHKVDPSYTADMTNRSWKTGDDHFDKPFDAIGIRW